MVFSSQETAVENIIAATSSVESKIPQEAEVPKAEAKAEDAEVKTDVSQDAKVEETKVDDTEDVKVDDVKVDDVKVDDTKVEDEKKDAPVASTTVALTHHKKEAAVAKAD